MWKIFSSEFFLIVLIYCFKEHHGLLARSFTDGKVHMCVLKYYPASVTRYWGMQEVWSYLSSDVLSASQAAENQLNQYESHSQFCVIFLAAFHKFLG